MDKKIDINSLDIDDELKEIFSLLATGTISYEEFEKRKYQHSQRFWTPGLLELRQKGDWKGFCDFVIGHYEVMPVAFQHFEEIPDELKYQFLIDCYEHNGDSLPIVREYVKQMRKWGTPELPHHCGILDTIVIYRAGSEDYEECQKCISWTLDINIARFFQKRSPVFRYIYRGLIDKNDILAFNNGREEQEIMQYDKVYDIYDITDEIP